MCLPEKYLSEMPATLATSVDEETPQPWHELTLQDADLCKMSDGGDSVEEDAETPVEKTYKTVQYAPLAEVMTEEIRELMHDVSNCEKY